MSIRIYNTLTQTKEPLQTVRPGHVGMYVCGPTVYSYSHIGHMVGPVIFDTVKRYLVYSGYQVTWVVNITDVDDKLINRVRAEGAGTAEVSARVKALAEDVTADYLRCLKALNVKGIDHMPRATDHIGDIIAITRDLIGKGFAYAAEGDVYFDVTKDNDYGKLSHRNPDELEAGARIEPTEKKRHPGDFALWKGSKPGEPAWESPWGPGRPGWHIECSAMSAKLLGPHFDIHGGGLDLVFPHHENEVAQSESHTGQTFATYWMHNGLLTKGGRKISKSDPDTIVQMNDLLSKYDPDTIRSLLLSSHYRRPIDYSNDRLDEINRGLQAFRNLFGRFQRISGKSYFDLIAPARRDHSTAPIEVELAEVIELRTRFLEAMDDDFNTGGALGALFDMVRVLNRFADQERLELSDCEAAKREAFVAGVGTLKELTNLLGLFEAPLGETLDQGDALSGPLMELLISLRAQLRKAKNFALADQIRDRLNEIGVRLEDRAEATTWKYESP
jgi:cysteinyl-tRNA synthetase